MESDKNFSKKIIVNIVYEVIFIKYVLLQKVFPLKLVDNSLSTAKFLFFLFLLWEKCYSFFKAFKRVCRKYVSIYILFVIVISNNIFFWTVTPKIEMEKLTMFCPSWKC